MASGDVVASVIVGGQIDKIKEIGYPEAILPKSVNDIRLKGFRLESLDNIPVSFTHNFTKDIYLTHISVSYEESNDLDYWEFEIGTDKICETIYTQEIGDDNISSQGFSIVRKITTGTDIKFSFYNESNIPKKVWVTIGYMLNNGV